MELLLCNVHVRDWVTVPCPSLAQEFGTICHPHYDKLFPLLLSKDSWRLICMFVRLIANFRLLFLWTPAQCSLSEVHVIFCQCLFIYFLWPPYAPAQVNGGSRKFYTWWTLSVNREVTTWTFSWSSLNYRVGQKVTKFDIFSDHARKLSALTPERGRIL